MAAASWVAVRPPFHDRQRGSILITVLWVIMVMSVLVMGLGYESRSDMERARLNRDRTRAYWLARAGVEAVKYDYAQERMSANRGLEQKTRYKFEFETGWAECLILSNASGVSINSDNEELWLQLLKFYGLEAQEADEVKDAILDWTDQDELQRLNGCESDYYQTLSPPYFTRNGPFFSVDEILLVRGISEDMFYGSPNGRPGLKDILTVGGQHNDRFDINTCPKGVLQAFLELTDEQMQEFVRAREEKMFTNLGEAAEILPPESMDLLNKWFMTFRGGTFTIRSTGFVYNSPARYTVEDEVRHTGTEQLYIHLSHKDFTLDHVDETPADEGTINE